MVLEREEVEDDSRRIDCPVLVTERLVLRPPHRDDLRELVALANDRQIADMLARMPHPYGASEARAFISGSLVETGGCQYAVANAENGAFLGAAGLTPRDGGLVLGYWIGRRYWGRGYATEAAHALIDLAFRATDVDAVAASCRVINPASRRVIQKCGFQYVGQGMIDSIAAGRVPVERYQLDRKTWLSLKSWGREG